MSMTPELKKFDMTEWPIPEPLPRFETYPKVYVCPQVGLPLKRKTDRYDLKRVWFYHDVKSWHIDEFRRVALYNLMKRNLDHWEEWLRFDSTPKFYRIVSRLRRENDGAVIGIAGPKRSGKSLFGQMVLTRVVNNTPHVLFRYREFEAHVQDIEDLAIGVQIDEDLKATGSESKNLAVHVNNAFETSRKAELWAVCTGVNLSFEGWGDTLDLRLIPWGFNTRFQATRAAVVDKNRDFLGFMVLQRKHRPEDIVYYAETLGSWGEYKPRAIAYSRSIIREGGATGAVDDVTQDRHVEAFKDYLRVHCIEKKSAIPTDLMCRRLYRKAKLPSKSIGYMNEIIQWAKAELDVKIPEKSYTPRNNFGGFSKDWEGLRQFIEQWCLKKDPPRPIYATATSLWIVPDNPPLSQDDIFDLIDFGANPVKVATLTKEIRNLRRRIQRPDREFTDFTESWLASQLVTIGARKLGGQDDPDIILSDGRQIAVKFSVRNDPFYDYTVAPETDGVVVIIIPRRLQFFCIPIKNNVVAEHLQLDNESVRAGGALVGIDDFVGTIKEMLEDV